MSRLLTLKILSNIFVATQIVVFYRAFKQILESKQQVLNIIEYYKKLANSLHYKSKTNSLNSKLFCKQHVFLPSLQIILFLTNHAFPKLIVNFILTPNFPLYSTPKKYALSVYKNQPANEITLGVNGQRHVVVFAEST